MVTTVATLTSSGGVPLLFGLSGSINQTPSAMNLYSYSPGLATSTVAVQMPETSASDRVSQFALWKLPDTCTSEYPWLTSFSAGLNAILPARRKSDPLPI